MPAHLVVCGDKRGTAAWLRAVALEGASVPGPGTVSLVTDAAGVPRCAIRSEAVRRLRFGDADAEIARLEGEGDLSLEDWRDTHRRYFEAEAARHGLRFSDDEEIFVERFSVLHVVGRLGAPAG
jgi:uncharacterized protein YhfF